MRSITKESPYRGVSLWLFAQRAHEGNLDIELEDDVLLPTPIVRDFKDGSSDVLRNGETQTDTVARAIFSSGEVSEESWGQYSKAIQRWELLISRKAPSPTRPDGKDGNHRLSPEFTEWMMGLESGHVTNPEIGISRNDQLMACGNGVVPQQAVLALSYLLGGAA